MCTWPSCKYHCPLLNDVFKEYKINLPKGQMYLYMKGRLLRCSVAKSKQCSFRWHRGSRGCYSTSLELHTFFWTWYDYWSSEHTVTMLSWARHAHTWSSQSQTGCPKSPQTAEELLASWWLLGRKSGFSLRVRFVAGRWTMLQCMALYKNCNQWGIKKLKRPEVVRRK